MLRIAEKNVMGRNNDGVAPNLAGAYTAFF